jgi:hypothetical protein
LWSSGLWHHVVLINFTPKMEVICFSETLVTTYQTTWYHNPEDHNQHLHHHDNLNHFSIILSSMPMSSKWCLSFRLSNQNAVCIPNLLDACYIPCPSHSPSFYQPNIWWRVKIVKVHILPFSIVCHFISLRSKYSHQHTVLAL